MAYDFVPMTAPSLVLLAILAQSPGGTPEAKAVAQSLLSEGTRLFDTGEFASALEKFTQAYVTYASPKLLYNIAQTHRALGRWAEAMETFERFIAQAPDDLGDMSTEVRSTMAELQTKLGRLHIECSTPQAEISMDGRAVGVSPLRELLWAEPGRHQITARHPDMIPVVEDVEVSVGAIQNVMLVMQPRESIPVAQLPKPQVLVDSGDLSGLPPGPVKAASPPVGEVIPLDRPDRGWWLGRKWTWVAAGSTVALVTAASVVGASMQSRYDSLNRTCGSASPTRAGCSQEDIEAVTDRRDVANVLWALTGAAAVATGILFFVEGRSVTVSPLAISSPGMSARVTY